MASGLILIVLPPLLLLLVGVAVIVRTALGRRSMSTAGFVLRLVAGIGVLACIVLGLSGLWLEINYAAVFLPVIALILGGVWLIVFLGAALLTDWAQRHRG